MIDKLTALEMLRLYTKEAKTYKEISQVYGLTAERVRQIINPLKNKDDIGGVNLRAVIKKIYKSKEAPSLEKKCLATYGCSRAFRDQYGSSTDPNSLVHKFVQQKTNARTRGIDFLFTFPEWIEVWEKSGHLEQRGVGPGKYHMTRICDIGPYAIDNVEIKLHEENSKEARQMDFVRGRWQQTDLMKLAEKAGLKYETVHSRIKTLGWSVEKAINTPIQKSTRIYKRAA